MKDASTGGSCILDGFPGQSRTGDQPLILREESASGKSPLGLRGLDPLGTLLYLLPPPGMIVKAVEHQQYIRQQHLTL